MTDTERELRELLAEGAELSLSNQRKASMRRALWDWGERARAALARAAAPDEQPNAFWREQAERIAEVMAGICQRVEVVPTDTTSILSMAIALGEAIQGLRASAPAARPEERWLVLYDPEAEAWVTCRDGDATSFPSEYDAVAICDVRNQR